MRHTIEALGRRLRARELTSLQATDECLDRIARDNEKYNAFILVLADEARAQAREADRELEGGRDRGPLHGIPISIKDLFDLKGTPTTAASRVREGHRADGDAPAIAHLREAGAVFVGKTNLHEFAFGTTNEDSAFGPARNPHDPSRSPGGSSGGSAISLVAGMAAASLGSDSGGSIRIPAAACGTVGLKATYGEVSTAGVVPLYRSLDHVGPLTNSVVDAYVMYRALIGDFRPRPLAAAPIRDLRIGVLRAYFCDLLDDEVRRRFDEAIGALVRAGARATDLSIAHANDIATVFLHMGLPEAAAYHARTIERMPERYTDGVRQRIELGRHIAAEDYIRALAGRRVLTREVDAALDDVDALVLPSLPIPAPPIGAAEVKVGSGTGPARTLMLRLTQLFNMTGHPAFSIPCGTTSAGLPCGLQIVGARGRTDDLCAVAAACETVLGS